MPINRESMDMDYSTAASAVADTLAAAGKPLTDTQRRLLAGAMAPWLEKARQAGLAHARAMHAHCQRNGINYP